MYLPVHWSVVFGKNGSGKSTIAHALYQYSQNGVGIPVTNGEMPVEAKFSYVNEYGKNDPSNGGNQQLLPQNCFVYGDDYRREKIRFSESNLGAIAVVEANLITKQKLQDANAELEGKKDDYDKFITEFGSETQESDRVGWQGTKGKEVNEKRKNVERCFKSDGLGLDDENSSLPQIIGKLINRNSTAKRYRFENIQKKFESFTDNSDSGYLQDEKERLRAKLKQFLSDRGAKEAKENNGTDIQKIAFQLQFDELKRLLEHACQELCRKSEVCSNSLAQSISDPDNHVDIKATEDLVESGQQLCSLCLQELSAEYREDLRKALDSIRADKDNQKAQGKIAKLIDKINSIINRIQECCSEVEQLSQIIEGVQLQDFQNTANNLGNSLKKIALRLQEKLNKPGLIDDQDYSTEIYSEFDAFYGSIAAVNSKVEAFEKNQSRLDQEKDELVTDLEKYAVRKFLVCWEEYQKAQSEYENGRQLVVEAKRRLDDADGKVRELESSFKGYGTALKEINNNLQIVFLDSNRLSLEDAGNGEYQIKSRGKAVSLSQLSDGEKNAIALSAFFASIFENKQEDYEFNSDMLLVLDDPISSFDFVNETGILGLVQTQCRKIRDEHCKQKEYFHCMILTHSIPVLYEFNTLGSSTGGLYKQKKDSCCSYELKVTNKISNNTNVSMPESKELNVDSLKPVYMMLTREVYAFVAGSGGRNDRLSGNDLRRAFEEYSFFNFDEGATALTSDDQIIDNARLSQEIKQLIKDTQFHYWFNGDSHGETSAKSGGLPIHFPTDEGTEEKLAKLLLIFLDGIHPTGLIGILCGSNFNQSQSKKKKEVEANLKKWKNELLGISS